LSTKVHVAVDALGNPVRVLATAGPVADITQAETLLAELKVAPVIADKGYDSSALVQTIEDQGAQAVIPPRSHRQQPRDYDKYLDRDRNLVERFLNQVKHCRRVATRYEKTARNYLAFWQLASIMVLLA
jgi:transposase